MNLRFCRPRFRAGAALLMLAAAAVVRAAATAPETPSITDFLLPIFGDDTFKAADIQGTRAQRNSADDTQVDVKNMTLRLYTGGAALRVEMTISSAQATVLTRHGQAQGPEAHGPDELYIISADDSYRVRGSDWSWTANDHHIHLGRDVLVTFTAAATAAAGAPAASSQPVTIQSDTLEIFQHQETSENQFIFSGNVIVTDRDSETHCQTLEVLAARGSVANPAAPPAPAGGAGSAPVPASLNVGHVENIKATGSVDVHQGNLEAKGDEGELFPAEQRVVLSGSPEARAITSDSSDVILQGGRITWLRDRQEFEVEPGPIIPDAPPRVRVSLPPLATYQTAPSASASSVQRLIVTGESLHAQFGEKARRLDIERSVHVEDPSLTVDAAHLDAEFDPPAIDPSARAITMAESAPKFGKLNHLLTNGGVVIHQLNQTTTTGQAEIMPAEGEIRLTGNPHIVDSAGSAGSDGNQETLATIDGSKITLSSSGGHAMVEGTDGHPAQLLLPSLPGLGDVTGGNVATNITSNSLTMDRGSEFSNFVFNGNVHIIARDMDATCGILEAKTHNVVADSADDPLAGSAQMGEIMQLIARNHVEIQQLDYKAHAARAEIYPRTALTNDSADATAATATQHRSVELFGDPAGVDGPIRPQVELPPTPDSGLGAGSPGAAPANSQPTVITSDEQWLLTSPTSNTFYFKGNVHIDGGNLQATCGQMRAEGTAAKSPDGSTPGTPPGPISLERIIAEGDVHITQNGNITTADKVEIFPKEGWKVVQSGKGVVPPTIILHNVPLNFDNAIKPRDKSPAGTSP